MSCACARIRQTYGHCHGDRRACEHRCVAVDKFKPQLTCWEKARPARGVIHGQD